MERQKWTCEPRGHWFVCVMDGMNRKNKNMWSVTDDDYKNEVWSFV